MLVDYEGRKKAVELCKESATPNKGLISVASVFLQKRCAMVPDGPRRISVHRGRFVFIQIMGHWSTLENLDPGVGATLRSVKPE